MTYFAIYFMLFVALLLQPHFTRHVDDALKPYMQSLAILIILGIAYLVYLLSRRELNKKGEELKVSQGKLLESFEYIGKFNRRLPLLKNLSTDLLANPKLTKQHKKIIFSDLLATAIVSIAKANWGLFRLVEISSKRTVKEFIYTAPDYVLPQQFFGNSELVEIHNQSAKIKTVGKFNIIPVSDEEAEIQGFLIFPKPAVDLTDEYLVLQAIVDQMQLFYKYLFV